MVPASVGCCRLEIPALIKSGTWSSGAEDGAVSGIKDYEHEASAWPRAWHALDAHGMSLNWKKK